MKNIRFTCRIQKSSVLISTIICLFIFAIYNYGSNSVYYNSITDIDLESLQVEIDAQGLIRHESIVEEYYNKRKVRKLVCKSAKLFLIYYYLKIVSFNESYKHIYW